MNIDYPHPATLTVDELLKQCDTRRQRRSGPGGQHRNKVETAVVITHQATGVAGEASERRSQAENQKVALFRLRINLALALRTVDSLEKFPSQLWNSRIKKQKISVNSQHQDFPALLSEALDVLNLNQWEVKPAAELLICSSSQLLKFLKQEPKSFILLNDLRRNRDLKPLK